MGLAAGVRFSPDILAVHIGTDVVSDTQVIEDARRIVGEPEGSDYVPTDARELCGRIMHTSYMGTENSSADTRGRAKELAEAIGRSVSFLHGS
jgi:hypothetical protein